MSGCGDTAAEADSGATSDSGSYDSGGTDAAGSDSGGSDAGATTTDCTSPDQAATAVCGVEAFLATLSADQRDAVTYDFSDSTDKTCWSNLPGQARAGVAFGDLSESSRAAAMAVAATVLSDDGYQELRGLLAADDYLNEQGGGGGGGPGGLAYGSDNAHFAIFGTPSTTSDWMLAIGNHHMAYNITFVAGTGYPTPSHQGAEPRGEFTIDSETFGPLVGEGDAFVALFGALDSTQLGAARISGTYGDVLLGPREYCTGSYDSVTFPSGSGREGVLVSSLSAEQQTLVTAAIEQWVRDYEPFIADGLVTAYTSASAYADTYVGWAGSSSGPDVTVNGTYFRIDGPRVWIELSCQNGVVLSGTHYHSIYRDRSFDYGSVL
ncbi:MAG: DUF3500 domain-containing protein [Sandaracinaceae bacterium]|nr:DUF3500 domain-containing protein [Sandaracinaceae bacterium]